MRISRLLVGVVLLVAVNRTSLAYMFIQTGLSHPTVVGDRVFVIQADRSLTVLDFDTGAVIARLTDLPVSGGEIRQAGNLVVMASESRAVAIDPRRCTLTWSIESMAGFVITDDLLLGRQGGGVAAYRIEDGERLWTFEREGYWEVIAAEGTVLLYAGGRWTGTQRLVLLDELTGEIRLDIAPPDGVRFLEAYFDGEQVYLANPEGWYGSGYGDGDVPPALPPAEPELIVLDLAGREVRRAKLENGDFAEPFTWEGRRFHSNGTVSNTSEPPRELEYGGTELSLSVDGGRIVVERHGEGRDTFQTIRRIGGDEVRWAAMVSHLSGSWGVTALISAGECVLIATDRGQLECLDGATGEPRWLYVSPTERGTISYTSPNGLPPRLTDQAASYERDNADPGKAVPSQLLRTGFDPAGATRAAVLAAATVPATSARVVKDPSPSDPFAGWWRIVWGVRGWAAAVVGLLTVILWFRKRNDVGDLALGLLTVLVVITAFAGLLLMGRVSTGATWTLKAAALAAGLVALGSAWRMMRAGRWGWGPVVLGLLGAIA